MVNPRQELRELVAETRAWLARAQAVQAKEEEALRELTPASLDALVEARWMLAGALEELLARWQSWRAALAAHPTIEDFLRAQGDEALRAEHEALLAEMQAFADQEALHAARLDACLYVGEALLSAARAEEATTYGPSGTRP